MLVSGLGTETEVGLDVDRVLGEIGKFIETWDRGQQGSAKSSAKFESRGPLSPNQSLKQKLDGLPAGACRSRWVSMWLAEQAAMLYVRRERVPESALAGRQEGAARSARCTGRVVVREWQARVSPEARSLFSWARRTPFSSLLVRLAPGKARDRDLAKRPGR